MVRVFNPTAFHTQNDSPRISDDPTINMPLPELADASLSEQLGLSVELLGRHPVSHFWDPGEPRLLAVEFTAPGGEVGGGRTKAGKDDQLARNGKYTQVGYRYVALCSLGILLLVLLVQQQSRTTESYNFSSGSEVMLIPRPVSLLPYGLGTRLINNMMLCMVEFT